MAIIKKHQPVKGFAGITFSEAVNLEKVLEPLQLQLGRIDQMSEIFTFDPFTDFYQVEMGSPLKKVFVAFAATVQADFLPEMKHISNKLENEFLVKGNRIVNIDPGYLTQAKVVLATTKDYSHRIYLTKGIFGDLHLVYKDRSYQSQPWTYPDYQQTLVISFFNTLRESFRKQHSEIAKNS